jgi:dTDP-4-dehydrorhamnose 3,5-epimerase
MIFRETALAGAYVIDIERLEDERGFFARTWCKSEFTSKGLNPSFVQANMSHSRTRGTVRGMHYQVAPCAEAKLVRCTQGAIYDVIIDLRLGSPSYKQWVGTELTADNHRLLYVPEGFAQGLQTLADDTDVFYQMSEYYSPAHQRGVRYDDPAFGIAWPLKVTVLSKKDREWPDYVP